MDLKSDASFYVVKPRILISSINQMNVSNQSKSRLHHLAFGKRTCPFSRILLALHSYPLQLTHLQCSIITSLLLCNLKCQYSQLTLAFICVFMWDEEHYRQLQLVSKKELDSNIPLFQSDDLTFMSQLCIAAHIYPNIFHSRHVSYSHVGEAHPQVKNFNFIQYRSKFHSCSQLPRFDTAIGETAVTQNFAQGARMAEELHTNQNNKPALSSNLLCLHCFQFPNQLALGECAIAVNAERQIQRLSVFP